MIYIHAQYLLIHFSAHVRYQLHESHHTRFPTTLRVLPRCNHGRNHNPRSNFLQMLCYSHSHGTIIRGAIFCTCYVIVTVMESHNPRSNFLQMLCHSHSHGTIIRGAIFCTCYIIADYSHSHGTMN